MSEETPFETIAQRAIVLAKALLSKPSKQYHDDVKNHPSEGELAQALMVVLPYFASLHIPETAPGEFGATVLMAEPTDRLALILRPCGTVGEGHALAACLYRPTGMSGETALKLIASVIGDMRDDVVKHDESEAANAATRH